MRLRDDTERHLYAAVYAAEYRLLVEPSRRTLETLPLLLQRAAQWVAGQMAASIARDTVRRYRR